MTIRPDALTRTECAEILTRSEVIWGADYGAQDGVRRRAIIAEWYRALGAYPRGAIEGALDWLRDHWTHPTMRPRLAHLVQRLRIQTSAPPTDPIVPSSTDAPAPPRCACGTALRLEGCELPDGTVHGRWRCPQCRWPAGRSWETAAARAWPGRTS